MPNTFMYFPLLSIIHVILGGSSSSSSSSSSGGCFALDTLVTTGSGEKKLMRDLKIGDEVVSDETGALTQFIGWMDLSRDQKTKMVDIKTDDGEQLTLTLTHILFYYEDDKPTSTYAKDLRPGNVLVGGSGEVCSDLAVLYLVDNCLNFRERQSVA